MQSRGDLFAYPLPDRAHSFYDELGLSPEATAAEIRSASTRTINRLKEEKAALQEELETVYGIVEGLRKTYEMVHRLETNTGDQQLEDLARAEKALAELEHQAEQIKPGFKRIRQRVTELEKKVSEIHIVKLESSEQRQAYDRTVPPCALLKLSVYEEPVFSENRLTLLRIREDISEFLAQQGEGCYHPTDFTRQDFQSDFSYHPIIDGAEHD